MSQKSNGAWRLVLIVIAVVMGFAWCGSQSGVRVLDWPVFMLIAMGVMVIQWLAFIPAYLLQTERFYDLVGSLSYVIAILAGYGLSSQSFTATLLTAMVVIWAVRLGGFLFLRVLKDGKDSRFDEIKPDAGRFFTAWTIQGLWVVVTVSAALAAVTSLNQPVLSWITLLGATIWLVGFVIETAADAQKRRYRNTDSQGFIRHGLWSLSRHPNYAGEIILWIGVAVAAAPVLTGWQYITLLSPVFVYLLLTRISGIPLLEQAAQQRWGSDPAYQTYVDTTPVLFPHWRKRRKLLSGQGSIS